MLFGRYLDVFHLVVSQYEVALQIAYNRDLGDFQVTFRCLQDGFWMLLRWLLDASQIAFRCLEDGF